MATDWKSFQGMGTCKNPPEPNQSNDCKGLKREEEGNKSAYFFYCKKLGDSIKAVYKHYSLRLPASLKILAAWAFTRCAPGFCILPSTENTTLVTYTLGICTITAHSTCHYRALQIYKARENVY